MTQFFSPYQTRKVCQRPSKSLANAVLLYGGEEKSEWVYADTCT